MGDLGDLQRDLTRFAALLGSDDVQHAIGKAAKGAALKEAERGLGIDRSFSGFARKAPLGAGYDTGMPVVLNLRPAGLWYLADEGRKRRGRINPRRSRTRRGEHAAVMTPRGPRAFSTYGPSRGRSVLTKLMKRLEDDVPEAAERAIDEMARKVLG